MLSEHGSRPGGHLGNGRSSDCEGPGTAGRQPGRQPGKAGKAGAWTARYEGSRETAEEADMERASDWDGGDRLQLPRSQAEE